MRASIQGNTYEVLRLRLTLEAERCPALSLGFGERGPHHTELARWCDHREEGSLPEAGVSFVLRDFGASDFPEERWEVKAVAAPRSVIAWLGDRPATPTGRTLVYQRTAEEPTAAAFLSRVAAHRLVALPPGFGMESVFPVDGCLLRPDGLTNREFLNDLLTLMQAHQPDVLGWTVLPREQQPIGLLTGGWPTPIDIDGWERLPATGRSDDRSGKEVRYRVHLPIPTADDFLKGLCERGEVLTDAPLAVPALPGPVLRAGRPLFARRLTYELSAEHERVRVTVAVAETDPQRTSLGVGAGVVEGAFRRWITPGDDSATRLAGLTPIDDRWVMMSPDQEAVDEGGELHAWLLSASDGEDGVYLRHSAGSPKRILLAQLGCPGVLGAEQHRREEFERRAVTIAGPSIALQTCPFDTGDDALTGLFCDADSAVVRWGEGGRLEIAPGVVSVINLEAGAFKVKE